MTGINFRVMAKTAGCVQLLALARLGIADAEAFSRMYLIDGKIVTPYGRIAVQRIDYQPQTARLFVEIGAIAVPVGGIVEVKLIQG